jgi:hypothetical protein
MLHSHSFHFPRGILVAVRNENSFSGVATVSAQPLNDTNTTRLSIESSSTHNTKLSVGVSLGVGFLVFAAFWALAFVLWTRRNDRKKAETKHHIASQPIERPPPVPEKEWSTSDEVRTLHHDLDIMIDQYERPWRSRPTPTYR